MSKAAKQIIIILGVLLVVSVGVALSTFSQKSVLEKAHQDLQGKTVSYEKDITSLNQAKNDLTNENEKLKNDIGRVSGIKDQLQEKVNDLLSKARDFDARINEAAAERNDLKKKYEKVSKERDDAVAKLQEVQEKLNEAEKAGGMVYAGDPDKQAENHWAQVLKDKAELNLRLEKLEADLNRSALNIEELKKKNSDLELEISSLKQEREELGREIKRRSEIADNISIDLVREKNDKKLVLDQFEKIKEENLALRAQVKELGAMKIVLEKSITKLQDDKGVIEKKLVQSEAAIQDRLSDVLQIKEDLAKQVTTANQNKPQEVMLPPIIVNGSNSGAAEMAQAGIKTTGQVVSVNQDNNFVIIDLGQSSGVNIGDRFSVYRGDAYVGDIEVIQVRTDISAADIKKQSMPLQAGDSVK